MKNMKIYGVTFKNGTARYYGFKGDCQNGDAVVADTSHGPLIGHITSILDELPDGLDEDKMRFILCKVPAVSEDSKEYRKERLEKRMTALNQEMDMFIEREKKNYLRLAFADYSTEFRALFDEYSELESELGCLCDDADDECDSNNNYDPSDNNMDE